MNTKTDKQVLKGILVSKHDEVDLRDIQKLINRGARYKASDMTSHCAKIGRFYAGQDVILPSGTVLGTALLYGEEDPDKCECGGLFTLKKDSVLLCDKCTAVHNSFV
jgi:hypothetical protein